MVGPPALDSDTHTIPRRFPNPKQPANIRPARAISLQVATELCVLIHCAFFAQWMEDSGSQSRPYAIKLDMH